MSNMIVMRRGCTRMRGCAGNRHSPSETQDERKVGVSRTEMKCVEDSGTTAVCARKEGVRFGREPKCVLGKTETEMMCADNSAYIKPDSVVESPVCVWSVTGSLLFRSPLGHVRGVPTQDPTWIVLVGFWFHGCFVWWIIMSSNMDSVAVNQEGAATSASTPLLGTFLGLGV